MAKHVWIGAVLLVVGTGCGTETPAPTQSKAELPDPVMDAKSDSYAYPTEHGVLSWGIGQRTDFSPQARFHAWDIELSGEATLDLSAQGASDAVDTVVYLYRFDPASERWGSYIAKNDDAGGSTDAHLSESVAAGRYRVVVRNRSDAAGAATVMGTCTGAGCVDTGGSPAGPTPIESGNVSVEVDFNWRTGGYLEEPTPLDPAIVHDASADYPYRASTVVELGPIEECLKAPVERAAGATCSWNGPSTAWNASIWLGAGTAGVPTLTYRAYAGDWDSSHGASLPLSSLAGGLVEINASPDNAGDGWGDTLLLLRRLP